MKAATLRSAVLMGIAIAAVSIVHLIRLDGPAAGGGRTVNLDAAVPAILGDWRLDESAASGVVTPEVRRALDDLYADEISRVYVNSEGQRAMLVIAYSADQASELSQVHRPEVCYTAQGFAVNRVGDYAFKLTDETFRVRRLIAERGPRFEPITYWTTMGDRVVLPGIERLRVRLEMALQREVPDGLLVRVSTVGLPEADAFEVQSGFIHALLVSVSPELRRRLAGGAA